MNAADILATLTEDDIADLEAVSDHTYSDDARLLRSIALGDDGRKLLGLGLVEERAPGRLAVTDDGLDVLAAKVARAAARRDAAMTPMDRLCAAARLWLATRGHEDAERGLAEAVRALDAQPVASAQSDECGAVDGVFGRGLGPVCTRPRRHSGGHEAVCPVTGRVVSGWPADVARPVSLDEQAHPMQPVGLDEHGVARFKANAIVQLLLGSSSYDLNALSRMRFSAEDRAQFAQLIGWSVSGFCDLSDVPEESKDAARESARRLTTSVT